LRLDLKNIRAYVDFYNKLLGDLKTTLCLQAIIFLYWLACGACFRVVAVSFNIPRSTAHRVTIKVLNETVALVHQVIVLPVGEQVEATGEGFERLCGSPVFRQAVGSIDGCHIRTLVPTTLHDQYINQKLYYSILLQGLVDHLGMFIDIFAGFPGSVHDMRALRHSILFRSGLYPPQGTFILGDKGYACIMHPITLIPPYKEPLNEDKIDFNFHLSRGRCIVERVFGIMKNRWRLIFTKALEVSLSTGVKVLGACAVLHNICVSAGEVLAPDVVVRVPDRRPERNEANAMAFRDLLLNLHTAYRNQM
jgi:DDE superfamily endonuclease